MSILIVTHSNDNDSVARVVEAVARKGGHAIPMADPTRYGKVLLNGFALLMQSSVVRRCTKSKDATGLPRGISRLLLNQIQN